MLQECYLENDHTSMFYVAQSLMTLQFLYGIIPNINGKGDCAKVCYHAPEIKDQEAYCF
jgi:hypothetical protein